MCVCERERERERENDVRCARLLVVRFTPSCLSEDSRSGIQGGQFGRERLKWVLISRWR